MRLRKGSIDRQESVLSKFQQALTEGREKLLDDVAGAARFTEKALQGMLDGLRRFKRFFHRKQIIAFTKGVPDAKGFIRTARYTCVYPSVCTVGQAKRDAVRRKSRTPQLPKTALHLPLRQVHKAHRIQIGRRAVVVCKPDPLLKQLIQQRACDIFGGLGLPVQRSGDKRLVRIHNSGQSFLGKRIFSSHALAVLEQQHVHSKRIVVQKLRRREGHAPIQIVRKDNTGGLAPEMGCTCLDGGQRTQFFEEALRLLHSPPGRHLPDGEDDPLHDPAYRTCVLLIQQVQKPDRVLLLKVDEIDHQQIGGSVSPVVHRVVDRPIDLRLHVRIFLADRTFEGLWLFIGVHSIDDALLRRRPALLQRGGEHLSARFRMAPQKCDHDRTFRQPYRILSRHLTALVFDFSAALVHVFFDLDRHDRSRSLYRCLCNFHPDLKCLRNRNTAFHCLQ